MPNCPGNPAINVLQDHQLSRLEDLIREGGVVDGKLLSLMTASCLLAQATNLVISAVASDTLRPASLAAAVIDI
jgi:hypothetical protein